MSLQTALVVDDSKLARITLQRLLQKHNLSVEVAESGVVALEKLKTSKPDIIFMDHLMPELDGFEATQKIKADPETSHIPVIMCTGKEGVDNYDEQARGIGASGTLSKPPQADQLALILQAAQSGERLVTATPAKAEPEVRPAAEAKPAAVSAPAAPAGDLEKVFERLRQLEESTRSFPSFDSFQERLSNAESSLTTLQESLISLRDAANEQQISPDDIKQQVKSALHQDWQQQLDNIKREAVDTGALKDEIISRTENLINQKIENLPTPVEPAPAVDEEALKSAIMANTESLIQQKISDLTPTAPAPVVDEGALTSGIMEKVEALVSDQISNIPVPEAAKEIDAEALLSRAQEQAETLINQRVEGLTAQESQAVDEVSLKNSLLQEVEALISQKADSLTPTEQSSSQIDEEALVTRLVQDVENTLKPLFDGELKSLEHRLSNATDEAISESRKDLDEQIRESIRNIEVSSPVSGEPDVNQLIERIRSQVADIATHSATAAIDVNIEDRLSALTSKLENQLISGSDNEVDIEALINDSKLTTLIEGTVEEQLRTQISKQGQELVQQIAKALREQTEDKEQEVNDLVHRMTELDRRQEAIMDRLNEMNDQREQGVSSPGSGGLILGGIALLSAAAALAKAFGVF